MAHGLSQLLKMDKEGIDSLQLNFVHEHSAFGETKLDPLCQGGEDMLVTIDNVDEYIQLYVDYLLNKSIERSFTAFQKGFWDVCKLSKLLKIFDASELEIVLCGVQDLNFMALKSITKYDGFDNGAETPVI